MNKGFKRLLSIVLIFAMVIGMMPISGQITAEATVYSARTIYVYVGGNAEYQANAKEDNLLCYWFINNFDPNEPEFRGEHIMTKEADNIYSCKIPRNVETIQIHYKDANGWLQGGTQKYVIDDADTAYYGISPNQGDEGYYMWTQDDSYTKEPRTYEESLTRGEVRTVQATFYDYLSDEELGSPHDVGSELSSGWNDFRSWDWKKSADFDARTNHLPFGIFNRAIYEKASSAGWKNALYTGDFSMKEDLWAQDDEYPWNALWKDNAAWEKLKWSMWDRLGDENPGDMPYFNVVANNNAYFGPNGPGIDTDGSTTDWNMTVRGLVDSELQNGKLYAGNANIAIPHFDEEFLKDTNNKAGKELAKIVSGDFPMVTTKTDAGNTKYTFDSTEALDNAYWKEDIGNFVYRSGKKYGVRDAESNFSSYTGTNSFGFFPFDDNTDGISDKEGKNFGFGARFEIDFTLPEGGRKNGEDITFNFSGDDDLWVFVDNKLVLDMGGVHAKANGNINFATQTTTITDDEGNVKNQVVAGSDGSFSYQSGQQTFELEQRNTHHMTIFYMERGLVSSNLKIEFTFDPIPAGLSLNNSVDVSAVNSVLQEDARTMDTFGYEVMVKKPDESEYQAAELSYTKDVDGQEIRDQKTQNNEAGSAAVIDDVPDSAGVKDIQYTEGVGSEKDLAATTDFKIQETCTNPDKYETTAEIIDLRTSELVQDRDKTDAGVEFTLGTEEDKQENNKVNYNIQYVNKLKAFPLKLTKAWAQGQTAPENGKYEFTIQIDIDGEGSKFDYKAYPLKAKITNSENKEREIELDENGQFEIGVDETISLDGIPIGASYKIVETVPNDVNWSSDKTDNTVNGAITEGDNTNAVTFTNRTNEITLNKTIYVEAGKDTPYTVKDGETVVKVNSLTPTSGVTTKINDNVPSFDASEADKKYDITYTGKKEDGTEVKGTITIFSYKATQKVYVFDYGLKSDLTKTNDNHDGLFQDGVFFNKEAQNTTDYKTSAALGTISDNGATPQTDITADPNGVTIKADGSAAGTVTFEPKGFMSQVENYNYTAKIAKENTVFDASDPETGTVVNGTIKVMPASVVYYEDNFNSGAQTDDSSMKIVYTGTSTTAGTSLDLSQSNGQTEQYGHDDAYNTAENQQDSGGSSTMLTANGYNTKAIFTFTGTGFDIIARTTTETAGIIYTIEKQDQATGNYSLARMGAVDTLYINGALYQLPVIHEDLEHGTYRVTLGIKQTGNVLTTKDENGNVIKEEDTRKYVVYLDGIRIYNPLGESGDENYITNEQDVTVSEVPGLIVGDGTVTETGIVEKEEDGSTTIINSQVISGAKAVIASYDSDDHTLSSLGTTQVEVSTDRSSGNSDSVLTYLNAGPNNELYLDETAALAFVVKADAPVNTLQIEAKLVDTQSFEKSVTSNGLALRVLENKNGTVEEKTIDTIQSSTAMYYRIPVEDCISLDDGYYLVVLLGNSDSENGGTHALSFSNLKYKNYTVESPYTTSAKDVGGYLAADQGEPSAFVSVNLAAGLKKNTWQSYNDHSITLTKNVFGDQEPKFTMYYVNAAGTRIALSVTAQKSENDDKTYRLRFKTPNAKGNFPVEIHYVIKGDDGEEESSDYISTVMKVAK